MGASAKDLEDFYKSPSSGTKAASDNEYNLLGQISGELKIAYDNRVSKYPELVEAVTRNSLLWTIFAAEAADQRNGLSEEIRAKIFWLAQYVDLESKNVLRELSGAENLIEINKCIMRGLRESSASI